MFLRPIPRLLISTSVPRANAGEAILNHADVHEATRSALAAARSAEVAARSATDESEVRERKKLARARAARQAEVEHQSKMEEEAIRRTLAATPAHKQRHSMPDPVTLSVRSDRKKGRVESAAKAAASRRRVAGYKGRVAVKLERAPEFAQPVRARQPTEDAREIAALAEAARRAAQPDALPSPPATPGIADARAIPKPGDDVKPRLQRKVAAFKKKALTTADVLAETTGVDVGFGHRREVDNIVDQLASVIRRGRSLFGKRIDSVESLFSAIDADGSGTIDSDELSLALRRLGVHNADVEAFVDRVDVDSDRQIDREELATMLSVSQERRERAARQRKVASDRTEKRRRAQLQRALRADRAASKALESERRTELMGGISGRGGVLGGALGGC